MSKIIMFLFLITSIGHCNIVKSQNSNECIILKKFLNEELFYTTVAIQLGYADTINIIDKTQYFQNCDHLLLEKKAIEVKQDKSFEPKRSYIGDEEIIANIFTFLITNVEINEELVRVHFFYLISNHSGYFEYRVDENEIKRVKYKFGQY